MSHRGSVIRNVPRGALATSSCNPPHNLGKGRKNHQPLPAPPPPAPPPPAPPVISRTTKWISVSRWTSIHNSTMMLQTVVGLQICRWPVPRMSAMVLKCFFYQYIHLLIILAILSSTKAFKGTKYESQGQR